MESDPENSSESLWRSFWRSLCNSCTSSSFYPLVWMVQKCYGLKPLATYTLSTREEAREVELRKETAMHLNKLHRFFLRVSLMVIGLELLRQPVIWLLQNSTGSYRGVYTTLFYLIYGGNLVVLLLSIIEVLKVSKIPALLVTPEVLRRYQADYLSGSSLFCLISVQGENPKDTFARRMRFRNQVRQEHEQTVGILDQSFGALDYSPLRTHSSTPHRSPGQPVGIFGGRSSPNRSWNQWNDTALPKYMNRSFGASHHTSLSRTPSPGPSVVSGIDWDPIDRGEVNKICGPGAFEKLLHEDEQCEKQRASFIEDDGMNWSSQWMSSRDQVYQTSGIFHIPKPPSTQKSPQKGQEIPADAAGESSLMQFADEKSYPVEDFCWMQLKVSDEVLHLWTENVRMWISDTVLLPLLLRIDQVNVKLREKLRMENVIGETAPDQLRLIAQQCRQDIPELVQVIPFLDISMQQDYVLKRLRELVKDGVLGDYCWNSGSRYGGQTWQDFLPTDAALVMHCFITFLDVLLPADPHAPNWRSFSHRYVLKGIGSWKQEPAEKPMIHLATSNPPKYEVLLNGRFLQVAEGKNNTFHTILLFTRLLYLREKSGKGYANLGPGRVIFKIFESISA